MLILSSQVHAYENPIPKLTVKRVNPEGAIQTLKVLNSDGWRLGSSLCYSSEINDPSLVNLDPKDWKISHAFGTQVKIKAKNIVVCTENKLSGFSLEVSPQNHAKNHYLIDLNASDPGVIVSETCPKDLFSFDVKLKGAFLGVGFECQRVSPESIDLRIHLGTTQLLPLTLKWNSREYENLDQLKDFPRDASPATFEVVDSKAHSYGLIQIRALPDETKPAIEMGKTLEIPFEAKIGFSHQSDTTFFSDTSPDNQTVSSEQFQIQILRRALIPLKPPFLKDLYYDGLFRSSLLGTGGNLEASADVMKSISMFRGLNTFVGLGIQYATELNADYGVGTLVTPELSLQADTPDLRLGGRIRLAYLGPSLFKFNPELFYTPPWKFLHGCFFSMNYDYLSVPKSSTGANYNFNETRIGLQIGYHFFGANR